MRAANITASVAIVLWFGLALLGRSSLKGVLADQVPDFPSLTMIDFTILFPMFLAAALLTGAWFCNAFGRWPLALGIAAVACIAAIFPYLIITAGGV